MHSLLRRIKNALHIARSHIQNETRYRYYPIYSLLLVSIIWALSYWPLTRQLAETWIAHPWVISLDNGVQQIALYLSLLLGFVGLVRRGWIPKIVSGFALYRTIHFLLDLTWYDKLNLYLDVTWYIFDKPIAWLQGLAGGDTFVSTCFYAVYLFIAWLILRPLVKVGRKRIKRAEGLLLDRYPFMRRFDRPVM